MMIMMMTVMRMMMWSKAWIEAWIRTRGETHLFVEFAFLTNKLWFPATNVFCRCGLVPVDPDGYVRKIIVVMHVLAQAGDDPLC